MSAFGVDSSKSHQSMSLFGLSDMLRIIPRDEFIHVLKLMDGVILDFDVNPSQVHIPMHYFTKS